MTYHYTIGKNERFGEMDISYVPLEIRPQKRFKNTSKIKGENSSHRLKIGGHSSHQFVKRYNSDFPYPVFAALPLVLVTGKTGKVFSGTLYIWPFRRAASFRRWDGVNLSKVVRIDVDVSDLVVRISLFSAATKPSRRRVLEMLNGTELMIDLELAAVCRNHPDIKSVLWSGWELVAESGLYVGLIKLYVRPVISIDDSIVALGEERSVASMKSGGSIAQFGESQGRF